jgi:hypothetical protein
VLYATDEQVWTMSRARKQDDTEGSMTKKLPDAKSARTAERRGTVKRAIASRGLGGLANDTNWDEFITGMRALFPGPRGWRPSYRCKCVDGPPSDWDVEWFYHLPFPMISVEWFDIAFLQETRDRRLPPKVTITNHAPRIAELLQRVGLEFETGRTMIFGYAPKSMDLFDAR